MATATDFDYQLIALPRRLVRRQSVMVLSGLTALMTPVVMIGLALDIPAARSGIVVVTDKRRWSTLQIHRSVVADEQALLDAVRSVGQMSIELETSLTQLAEA